MLAAHRVLHHLQVRQSFIQSSGIDHAMNKARRFELFSTELDVALFGVQLCAWMCLTRWVQPSTDLVIWTSSQMTFGQDKWTGWTEGSVDKERQGVRDKETEETAE